MLPAGQGVSDQRSGRGRPRRKKKKKTTTPRGRKSPMASIPSGKENFSGFGWHYLSNATCLTLLV